MELVSSNSQQVQIYLNMCHKDPKMREMFGEQGFPGGAVPGHRPRRDH